MKFHPIRKSWDLNEEVLKEVDGGVEGSAVVDVEDVEVEVIEVEDVEEKDVEEVEWEEVEVEDIGEVDEEIVSTASSVDTPSSPAPSVLTNDRSLPPSSDASTEFDDMIDSGDEVQGWSTLKRKASDELGVGAKSRWKVARREEAEILSDDGSGIGTADDGRKRSRSAIASQRLRESMKSGDFSADERKRKRFEEKCVEIDCGAQFRYQNVGWKVLHSRCSKWYKMSEP